MSDSKIQIYQTTKLEHEKMEKNLSIVLSNDENYDSRKLHLLEDEPREGAIRLYFRSLAHGKNERYDSYENLHTYRMARCFMKAVNSMMPEIMAKALRISENDLEKTKKEAEAEATEVLKELKS